MILLFEASSSQCSVFEFFRCKNQESNPPIEIRTNCYHCDGVKWPNLCPSTKFSRNAFNLAAIGPEKTIEIDS